MASDPLATRFSPPFPLEPTPVRPIGWIDPDAENLVKNLQQHWQFRNLGVAIVDLTARTRLPNGAGWITVAGWNMNDQRYVGSLVKIAAMFAAFRLRKNLGIAANQVNDTDGRKVFEIINRDWKGVVETAVPSATPDFPMFDQIFTISGAIGGWNIDFTRDFRHHMEEMIAGHRGRGDNDSASECVHRIGFSYVNGALKAEGLYGAGGGLWLGRSYGDRARNWMKDPRGQTSHGATAKAVADFLNLLEDGRLVSPEASREMRTIMERAASFFELSLDRAARPITRIYGKYGVFGTYSEGAVIERSHGGKRIRYAAVVLDAPNEQVIRDLAVKLDDYLLASH